MHTGTSVDPSSSSPLSKRGEAMSILSLKTPASMKRKTSATFSNQTSSSSSSNSMGTAPPTPTSPTHPASSDSQSDLSWKAPKLKKIRPGGGRRYSVTPSKSQVLVRTTPSHMTLSFLKQRPDPAPPANPKVPKLKIRTGGGRRHMAPARPKVHPPPPAQSPVESEAFAIRVISPSPTSTMRSLPNPPVPPSSSSPNQMHTHLIPTPATPARRVIRIPPAPRVPPPPIPVISEPLSPISLSPLQSPIIVPQQFLPSPSLSPSSPHQPFRALPSLPSPLRAPILMSSLSPPTPSANRKLPSPPTSPLFFPLTPPSPPLLPLLHSALAFLPEFEPSQSSPQSVFHNRRFSEISDVDTLPPYSAENPSVLQDSSSGQSSPSGYGSSQMVPVGHSIMRHGRNRYRYSSRITHSPNTLPTQFEEQEDGLDQNEALKHARGSSTASDMLFYRDNVMDPLFSGSASRPTHSRRWSSSTPPFMGGSGFSGAAPQQALSDDEGMLLKRRVVPLDTQKANREYKVPKNLRTDDDSDDSDVDPVVCESPGYQGDMGRFKRQMARYQDRKARYESEHL